MWTGNYMLEDIHTFLYEHAKEGTKFTWATVPWRIFSMVDTAYLRAALLFGGEEAEWLIDNLGWPYKCG